MNRHLRPAILLAYLENELPKLDRQGVEAHLAVCSSCADDLLRLKRDLPKVLEALHESGSQESPPPPKPWPSLEELLHQNTSEDSRNSRADPATDSSKQTPE